MNKIKLKNQIVLVNVAILAGLIYQYFRGVPVLLLVIIGLLCFASVNLIFLVRAQKAKTLK